MKTPDFWFESGSLAATLLTPVSALFDAAGRFARAAAQTQKTHATIICVGNLVAGGAGKTPTAIALSRLLHDREHAFLTRGYGGREPGPLLVDPDLHTAHNVGDEALLLAQAAPTYVARHRPAGAKVIAASGADIVIMDDGFQNPSLVKDISFLVVDGMTGFGNGRVIPAGPLRETVPNGLQRADAIVLIGEDRFDIRGRIGGQLPVFEARLIPTAEADKLAGRRVLAFAGIGRPQKFFDTLTGMGCEIAAQYPFQDHHPYRAKQIKKLLEAAATLDATPVTTEKDHLRLPDEFRPLVKTLPVELHWNNPSAIAAFLAAALA